MAKPFLSISNITVNGLNGTLFKDLTLIVNTGETWALTGESGSGKSALLQTIAGRHNVSKGEISYHFYDGYLKAHNLGSSAISIHKLIALVDAKHHFKNLSNTTDFYYQQRYNSSDSEEVLTVNNYLSQLENAVDAQHWTLARVSALFKLDNLADKQLIKLSNGETKRLMLAAALIRNPLLLLLDNPLTGLDVETRMQFDAILNAITASGITVIMSSAADEIPAAVSHVAALEDRTIVRTCEKRDFGELSATSNVEVVIDTEEIKALLNHSASLPTYRYIVKMNSVHIQYGEKVVLENVNWQILSGERWALLGANGAGKSTLLSLINGDNPQAYANDIILFDRQRGTGESIWDIKSKTGFVSPELHQYFPADSNCLDVIESGYYDTMGLFRQCSPTKAKIALQWMKALEIERYARSLLKHIPASAQRLCLLARALIKNPPLLIFDEPCQGLDAHQQLHFKTVVDMICSLSNVTLIYVTHYQNEIPESVDRVLRLDKGLVFSS